MRMLIAMGEELALCVDGVAPEDAGRLLAAEIPPAFAGLVRVAFDDGGLAESVAAVAGADFD